MSKITRKTFDRMKRDLQNARAKVKRLEVFNEQAKRVMLSKEFILYIRMLDEAGKGCGLKVSTPEYPDPQLQIMVPLESRNDILIGRKRDSVETFQESCEIINVTNPSLGWDAIGIKTYSDPGQGKSRPIPAIPLQSFDDEVFKWLTTSKLEIEKVFAIALATNCVS